MAALGMNALDLPVEVASRLRCYDGQGDENLQQQLAEQAEAEVQRLLESTDEWQAWITYHNYYKAPDLVGQSVCRSLNIPYFVIEASIAKSRLTGPWASFAASADNATRSADCVFYLTEQDRRALAKHKPPHQKLVRLPPFLNQTDLPAKQNITRPDNRLLAVGMHRYGDKLESYRILADALIHLKSSDWRLSIVGDGSARADIEKMFAGFGKQVVFLGQLDRTEINAAYQQATVFVWPGVNEAFGMVYLEAQAAGIPVVAQDRSGVREVIASSESLVPVSPERQSEPQDDAKALALRIDKILGDSALQESMVKTAYEFIRSQHLLDSAARTLTEQLQRVLR